MVHKSQKDKFFWDETTAIKDWKKLCFPWRPSPSDIKNYKKAICLSGIGFKNVLLLGATPELRDLAAELGGKVWLADYSKNMITETNKLLKVADSQRENWVVTDWLYCRGLKKNFFNIVLGDLVLRLISFDKQIIFLKKITDLLKPQGFFITRIHFVSSFLRKFSSEKIIGLTLALSDPHVPGKGRYVGNLLVSRLQDKNFSLKDQIKIRKESWVNISNYLKRNPNISLNKKRILKGSLARLSGKKAAPFFLQEKEEIEKKINRFFNIKRRLIAKDYDDAKFFPVYILEHKL